MKHIENITQLKEYLKSYRFLKCSIQTIHSLILIFHYELAKDKQYTESLFKIHTINNISDLLMNTLYLLTEEKWELCLDILKNIHQLEHELEKNVLVQKYINGYTWEQICESFNYSLRQIYNIHNRALHNLLNIMQKN